MQFNPLAQRKINKFLFYCLMQPVANAKPTVKKTQLL